MTELCVVDAAGSPRELGRAHGEQMRSTIAEAMGRWSEVIERQTHLPLDLYLAGFASATDFRSAIDRWTPQVVDEVIGLAEGAGQDYGRMLAYQLMDEEWAHRVDVMRSRAQSVESCTAFGVARTDGTALLAQNMDLPSHYDGSQILLRLRPDGGPAVMLFTPAGMIGTTGLNERGVGVCVNAIVQLRHSDRGLPVSCVLRAMLACETLDDAVRILTTAPHATGQNYVVGGPEGVKDFEASPGQVRSVGASGAHVMHTNHPLANDDLDPGVAPNVDSTTHARLARLRQQLSEIGADVIAAAAERALSDRVAPICVSRGGDWLTLGSVVMELSESPVLHVAPGPPDETPYIKARFAR